VIPVLPYNHMPDLFVAPTNQPPESNNDKKPTSKDAPPAQEAKRLPLFSAYCEKPKGVSFLNQEPDEQVVLFLRRHFVTNMRWILFSIILLMLPLSLPFFADFFSEYFLLIPPQFVIILLGFYYLIVFGYIYLQFVTWFYNVGIITDKQVIDVDFTDIMYRDVAKTRIESIIDAEFTQGGFLDTIFHFGNLNIQTEGIKPNFEFREIPHPDRATDIILELKEGKPNNE